MYGRLLTRLSVLGASLLAATLLAVPALAQSYQFPTAAVLGVTTNCGLTNIIGYFEDANGGPVNGIAARIRTADQQWTALSSLSAGGAWDLVLAPEAKAGDWQLWVDIDGVQQSPVINIRTDGPERCGPNNPGVQTVWVKFTQQPSGQFQQAAPNVAQPTAAAPAAAPIPAQAFPYNAVLVSTDTSCHTTRFSGRVLDRNGNGVQGVTVRIQTDDGFWTALSFPSDPQGNWELAVAPEAKAGGWVLFVESGGGRVSPGVPVTTTGITRCGPGSGGTQLATINFQQE
jgi:hypothetical protein